MQTVPAGKRHPITSAESQLYIDTGELPNAAQCYGSEDQRGNPTCEGDDVYLVVARALEGEVICTAWCAECRRIATDVADFTIVESVAL